MMTKAMEIYNKRSRVYKVIYENIKTKQQYTIYVESSSVYEASEAVLINVGEETHDLIMAIAAKPNEMH